MILEMKYIYAFTLALAHLCHNNVNAQATTFLDNFIPQYRFLRYTLFNFIGRSDGEWSYNWNLKRGKVQKPFPESHPFFCDPDGPGKRSQSVPKSVHKLRPGDIDIIAAIGDSLTAKILMSLTAGNGAMATNILQVVIENKGIAGTIGGQATWHKYLTLPNIIKVFNPKLYGYSLADGYSTDRVSRFNTAEMGGMSMDIPHEAKAVVKRMASDPNVKINEHWKLITILIGPNDFCLNLCHTNEPEKSIENYENDLIAALRTLRNNLPRTMVNLLPPPSIKVITELVGKPLECQTIHHVECPCIFGFLYESKRELYFNIMERWQQVASKVANMEEFNTEDFTVNNQPFLTKARFPKLPNGNSDYTYMSLDCFHLSQKAYARASNALWNNMLQPEGQKSTSWKKEFAEFLCPTTERPYIATKKNS